MVYESVPWSTSSCWTKLGPPNLDDEHWSTVMFFQACATIFRKQPMFIFDSLLGKEFKTFKNLMKNTRKITVAIFIRVKKKQVSGYDSQLSSCKLPSCELMYPIARHS